MFLAKDCNWRRFPFVETFKLLNVNCNSLCLFRKILFTELSSKFIYERERESFSQLRHADFNETFNPVAQRSYPSLIKRI